MVGPDLRREEVVDDVVGRVLDHLDLLQHDRLLALQLLGIEQGSKKNIGQEVNSEWKVFIQDLDVEAGVFFGREGVHLTAHRVHLAGDGLGRPGGRALEDQVLDQVGHAAAPVHLVARSRLDPDPHGDRPNVRHPFRDDPDAVRQDGLPVVFGHVLMPGVDSPRWGS